MVYLHIFTHIWFVFMVNVGTYTIHMDPMGPMGMLRLVLKKAATGETGRLLIV